MKIMSALTVLSVLFNSVAFAQSNVRVETWARAYELGVHNQDLFAKVSAAHQVQDMINTIINTRYETQAEHSQAQLLRGQLEQKLNAMGGANGLADAENSLRASELEYEHLKTLLSAKDSANLNKKELVRFVRTIEEKQSELAKLSQQVNDVKSSMWLPGAAGFSTFFGMFMLLGQMGYVDGKTVTVYAHGEIGKTSVGGCLNCVGLASTAVGVLTGYGVHKLLLNRAKKKLNTIIEEKKRALLVTENLLAAELDAYEN